MFAGAGNLPSSPQVICTSGCALMMAWRLVACGSSVYVQKKSSCVSGEPEALETCSLGGAVGRAVVRCGCCTVAIETEEDMMANVYGCAVGRRGGQQMEAVVFKKSRSIECR